MKLVISIILIYAYLHGAISEFKSDDYQILIGENFDDEALDVIEDHDYNISVIGYTQNFNTSSKQSQSFNNAFDYLHTLNSKNGEQLRLIKLDTSAKIVNDTGFRLSEYNRGTHILKTVQNGYILGGYTHSGQMLISSLDVNAKQTSMRKFGTANFDQLHALIKLEDGGSVAIGTSQTSRNTQDDIFLQGLGKTDVYLVKHRPNGEVSWTKKYGSPEKDIGVDGVATGDGGFILLSTSKDGKDFEVVASKISDTGDTTWIKRFPKEGRQKAFKIIRTNRGGYLISASFQNKNGQDNIRLIKIDNEGDILWEQNYFNDGYEVLSDISIDLKGNIIGVGYSQDSTQSDTDALVSYYDFNGKKIWERKFGKERQDAFNAITLLHDNTFAVVGFSKSFDDKGRQIWILKLNDDGTLVKKMNKSLKGLYEALMDEFKDNTQVHIYKDLHITHDGLIFKQGSASLTSSHRSVIQDFMPRLLKVLKAYRTHIKNLQINGYTSTEWNAPKTQRYLKNARLSNNRAMNILDYSYSLRSIHNHHEWMTPILSTDGYSYSNLIYADNKENKIRSRRVEFEIELK